MRHPTLTEGLAAATAAGTALLFAAWAHRQHRRHQEAAVTATVAELRRELRTAVFGATDEPRAHLRIEEDGAVTELHPLTAPSYDRGDAKWPAQHLTNGRLVPPGSRVVIHADGDGELEAPESFRVAMFGRDYGPGSEQQWRQDAADLEAAPDPGIGLQDFYRRHWLKGHTGLDSEPIVTEPEDEAP